MRILVTGADGYIGAVLTPQLMADGHAVTGLDAGFYAEGLLFQDARPRPAVIAKDLRRLEAADVAGFDAVVHLAELSNDPLGQQDPALTFEINHGATVRLAELAKAAGVKRFVYTSSCSAYGAGGDEVRTETSPCFPQTAYAECKIKVEQDVAPMAGGDFAPVFLRNATAFGASPRMRFDIVLNNLAGLAWTTKEIKMISDGSPWRPLVHVDDICRAIRCALIADKDAVAGEIFNVGSDAQNYRVREIAEIVGETFPGCVTTFGDLGGDTRSYRVSFAKVRAHMPEFETRWDARSGARQLHKLFSRIDMAPETFDARPFTRLKQLQHLIATRQIDDRFFWTLPDLETPDGA